MASARSPIGLARRRPATGSSRRLSGWCDHQVEGQVGRQPVDLLRDGAVLAGLGQLGDRGVGAGDVGRVVLVVVQLHDAARDVGLKCAVVVVEIGQVYSATMLSRWIVLCLTVPPYPPRRGASPRCRHAVGWGAIRWRSGRAGRRRNEREQRPRAGTGDVVTGVRSDDRSACCVVATCSPPIVRRVRLGR